MAMMDWIHEAIMNERDSQRLKWNKLHGWGWGDCSSRLVGDIVKSAVLTEECGEVSRAVLEKNGEALRLELVQVAAVAVAWLESMGGEDHVG
jgi:hypothetical protein